MNFAMQNIKKGKLDVLIKKFLKKKIKLIGIVLECNCFEYSEEGGQNAYGESS